LITARAGTPAQQSDSLRHYGQQVAHTIRRVSRAVAAPALLAMIGGLAAYLWAGRAANPGGGAIGALPGPAVVSLTRMGQAPFGLMAMSVGLLALAALPAVTVLLILVQNLRNRRWSEALIAAGVMGILMLSILLE